MAYTSNIKEISARLRREPQRIASHIEKVLRGMVTYFDMRAHERLPVWSGRAVRNMIWSEGSPTHIEYEPIGGEGKGDGNRAANQAAAQATLHAMRIRRPFGTYYLSNNARHIGLIEDGAAPTPEMSRTPNGVFRITIADMMRKAHGGQFGK